jgi:phosphatidylinositol-3-phosphatase
VPNYAWITPNLCNDTHDCSISTGDNWLKTWVPQILASSAWKQNGVLFITYDDGYSSAGCCT